MALAARKHIHLGLPTITAAQRQKLEAEGKASIARLGPIVGIVEEGLTPGNRDAWPMPSTDPLQQELFLAYKSEYTPLQPHTIQQDAALHSSCTPGHSM